MITQSNSLTTSKELSLLHVVTSYTRTVILLMALIIVSSSDVFTRCSHGCWKHARHIFLMYMRSHAVEACLLRTHQCQRMLTRACQINFRCRGVTVQLAACMDKKVVWSGQASQGQHIIDARARCMPASHDHGIPKTCIHVCRFIPNSTTPDSPPTTQHGALPATLSFHCTLAAHFLGLVELSK